MNRKLQIIFALSISLCTALSYAGKAWIFFTNTSDSTVMFERGIEPEENWAVGGEGITKTDYNNLTRDSGTVHFANVKTGGKAVYKTNLYEVNKGKRGAFLGTLFYGKDNNIIPKVAFRDASSNTDSLDIRDLSHVKEGESSLVSVFNAGLNRYKMTFKDQPSTEGPTWDAYFTLSSEPIEDGSACKLENSNFKYGMIFNGKCIPSCSARDASLGFITSRNECAPKCTHPVTGQLGILMDDGSCSEACITKDERTGYKTLEGKCMLLRTTRVIEGTDCDASPADYGLKVNDTCTAACLLPDESLGLTTPDGQCIETCKTRLGQLGVTGGKNDPCMDACITDDGLTGAATANNTCAPVCKLTETELGFFGPGDMCLKKCITARGQEGIRFANGTCHEAGIDDKKRMGVVSPDGTVRTYCKTADVEGYRDASGVCRALTEGSACTTSDNQQGTIVDGYCVPGAAAPTTGTTCTKIGQSCTHKSGKKTIRGKYVQGTTGCVCK